MIFNIFLPMRARGARRTFRNISVPLALIGLATISGCGVVGGGDSSENSRQTLGLTPLLFDGESTYLEGAANDELERADVVALSSSPILIEGSISRADDVDVFDFGPVQPGDHVRVEMSSDKSLDGVIALFDDAGSALLINDHRNVYLGRNGPFIDVVIRRASTACYVAVSSTPGYGSQGDYSLIAVRESASTMPPPNPDTVLLVFDGGSNVSIGGRPAINVPEFDAGRISTTFENSNDRIMSRIVENVRSDFAGFHVNVESTSEGTTYETGMTRVYFGTFDPALLGVAQGVDEFNATSNQQAIVFTDTFAAFMPLNPSTAEISRAIANVASHEIGHLLGLVHTSDPADIMDVTATLAEMLDHQSFRTAPLNTEVFPLGWQDSIQCLLDNVGGDNVIATLKHLRSDPELIRTRAKTDWRPARTVLHFSSCGVCGSH